MVVLLSGTPLTTGPKNFMSTNFMGVFPLIKRR